MSDGTDEEDFYDCLDEPSTPEIHDDEEPWRDALDTCQYQDHSEGAARQNMCDFSVKFITGACWVLAIPALFKGTKHIHHPFALWRVYRSCKVTTCLRNICGLLGIDQLWTAM